MSAVYMHGSTNILLVVSLLHGILCCVYIIYDMYYSALCSLTIFFLSHLYMYNVMHLSPSITGKAGYEAILIKYRGLQRPCNRQQNVN